MRVVVSLRNSLESVPLNFSKPFFERPGVDDREEFIRMLCNRCSDSFELIGVRHVNSAANKDLTGFNMKIVTRTDKTFLTAPKNKMGGYMRFVRRLVFAEADVPIDSENRAFGAQIEFRCKGGKMRLEGG